MISDESSDDGKVKYKYGPDPEQKKSGKTGSIISEVGSMLSFVTASSHPAQRLKKGEKLRDQAAQVQDFNLEPEQPKLDSDNVADDQGSRRSSLLSVRGEKQEAEAEFKGVRY